MEKEKMSGESPEKAIEVFRERMRQMCDEEKSGERKTAHFLGNEKIGAFELDPEKLTERDLGIWQKYESGALTPEEFKAYRRYNHEHGLDTSDILAQYIVNLVFDWDSYEEKFKGNK